MFVEQPIQHGSDRRGVSTVEGPRTIGDYTVIGELGRGSMGSIYLVRDRVDGKLLALKTPQHAIGAVRRTDDVCHIAFRNEVRAGVSLKHPHIIRLHAFRLRGRQPFLVMEYVPDGTNLKKFRTRENLLPVPTVLQIVIDCAMALGYIHGQDLVHRDIKPSNLLLTPDLKVKIADFGVAQFGTENSASTLILAGSPKYMSPEQIAQVPLNGQSDIFSLGVVLYELLTGRHPFAAATLGDLRRNIISAEPPALFGEFGPIRNALSNVLARALAKDKRERYETAHAFASDLLLLNDLWRREKRLSRNGTAERLRSSNSTDARQLATTSLSAQLARYPEPLNINVYGTDCNTAASRLPIGSAR